MSDGELVLQLGLRDGRNADAVVAAESLLAWVDLARDAARAIDPYADVRVELLGREEGSLRQLLRLVDDHAKTISEGADEYPYLKTLAVGLAVAVATSGLSVYIERALPPAVQEVELGERDRKVLDRMTAAIRENTEASRAATRFFRALEKDPAVTNVMVSGGRSGPPLVIVNRPEFAMRGGLYSPEVAAQPDEFRREVWSVILMHAPFHARARHWAFSRDGVRFPAKMADLTFLQAIVDGTVPISLQEGVRMEVEVEWRERLEGKVWQYVQDTRRIIRVISPQPGSSSLSTDAPKEDQQSQEDGDRDR